MQIRGSDPARFVISSGEVRAVSRTDDERTRHLGTEREEDTVNYYMEIFLHDGGSIWIDYDENKAKRDLDFELVANVIK